MIPVIIAYLMTTMTLYGATLNGTGSPSLGPQGLEMGILAALLEEQSLLKIIAHKSSRGPNKPWRMDVDEEGQPSGRIVAPFIERALGLYDDQQFRSTFRLSKNSFRLLLHQLNLPEYEGPKHHRGGAGGHNKHSPATALGITLYILAHGCSENMASSTFSIPPTTVHRLFHDTMEQIAIKLRDQYVKWPDMQRQQYLHSCWYTWCGIPGVVGAVDGTHIKIAKPMTHEHPTKFFCRKQFLSINLVGICDFDGRFTYFFSGWHGSRSDWKALLGTELGRALDATYYYDGNTCPWMMKSGVILGDSGYWPRPWLIVPYRRSPNNYLPPDQDVFNYRHSSGRIIIEQAYGILKGRWRVLHHGINTALEKVHLVVEACITLHNFLIDHEPHLYKPTQDEIEAWSREDDPVVVPPDEGNGGHGRNSGDNNGNNNDNGDNNGGDDGGNEGNNQPLSAEEQEILTYALMKRDVMMVELLKNPEVSHKRRRTKASVFRG